MQDRSAEIAGGNPKQFWSTYNSTKVTFKCVPSSITDGTLSATTAPAQADLLNAAFIKNFTKQTTIPAPPTMADQPPKTLLSADISILGVLKVIKSMRQDVASGLDGISSRLMKGCAPSISGHLASIFNLSLSTGCVPVDWNSQGWRALIGVQLPTHLSSSKVMERLIHNALLQHLLENDLLSSKQFGFRPFSSTQEALLSATRSWHSTMEVKDSITCVFLDLSKAFDTLPHSLIMES